MVYEKELDMPFGIQPIHIVIIILVAFLIFGASRLPEIGRALGRTLTEFKKGTKEAAEGFKEEIAKPGSAAPSQMGAPAVPPPSLAVPPAAPAQGAVSMTPARPASQVGNFCINCGAPNPPEARFCNSCGTKLPEKVA
jgi:TatA/E family protein of Tat protein translocase